jgi:UTP-glucose-1-phosphate uridylyltransferase
MSDSVDTAVVPIGGSGTRSFPVTTYLEKFMMPVTEPAHDDAGSWRLRPALAYMLDEFAGAGIKRVILVTTERGRKQFEEGFLDLNQNVRAFLEAQGKTLELPLEFDRRAMYKSLFDFEYIFQTPNDGYGTTVPLWLSKELLKGTKRFAYWGGDDFLYHQDGTSELSLTISDYLDQGTDHAVLGLPVPQDLASNYGVFVMDDDRLLKEWREKPKDNIPEHPLVNATRWLFGDSIWPLVENEMKKDRGNGHYSSEHQLTYVINELLDSGQTLLVHEASSGHHYCEVGDAKTKKKAEAILESYPRLVDIISEKVKSNK